MFRVGSFFRFFFALAFLTILVWSAKSSAVAQQDKSAADQGTSNKSQETDPLKRPINEKQKKQNAKSLTPDAIEKHNAAVRGYNADDATREGILVACGIAEDASAPRDAVSLNNLDDWYEFHQAVLK